MSIIDCVHTYATFNHVIAGTWELKSTVLGATQTWASLRALPGELWEDPPIPSSPEGKGESGLTRVLLEKQPAH